MYMTRINALDIIKMKSFERSSHPDAIMDALVCKRRRHTALAQDPADFTGHCTKKEIKARLKRKK